MNPRSFVSAVLIALVPLFAACDDDEEPSGPVGPFDLTFTGDASFQGAHGDQAIRIALVRDSDGAVVATREGTVSGSADPAFEFTLGDALASGKSYHLNYWIDSNFGGGAAGQCDPPEVDHQWRIDIGAATDDVTIDDTHRPGDIEAVCSTFAGDLAFRGDETFQGAHGGQTIRAAVVRVTDGAVVATRSGTVSSSATPSFSFDFSAVLRSGTAYRLDYWIDSNFGGGAQGQCNPADVDHQWRLDLGSAGRDTVIEDTHRPGETESVCSTFTADLVFEGDASFQGAHGGQTLRAAVVRGSDGAVMATMETSVSSSADPSFSVTFSEIVHPGVSYHLDYWVDSNFGGGTADECDPTDVDHQWRLDVEPTGEQVVTVADTHRPTETSRVCGSFAADLLFEGDDTFQGAHGGQTIQVGLVRASDGAVITTMTGTVSGSADPSFSFELPGSLRPGTAYHVDYWIDSNFGGGSAGQCDSPDVDHQWRLDVGPTDEDVEILDTHRPTETQDVCMTFTG